MPLFSIVTPVYNNEKYIRNAVDSVLSQDFDDYEYIIVDDGSTDNTPKIIDEIAAENERVHVIHQKNQWIYASFNNGIRAACGKYVYILNSDDKLRSGALKNMSRVIKGFDPDVIWTKVLVHKCDVNQNIIAFDYLNLDRQIQEDIYFDSAKKIRKNWFLLMKCSLNQNQANLYKRDLMIDHPFRNDVYGADVLFNISIANDIQSSFIMKDAVYDFMEYGEQNMNASIGKWYPYLHKMFDEIYLANKALYELWEEYTDEVKIYLAKRRMGEVTSEISAMKYPSCDLTIEEKIEAALHIFEDDNTYQCALENNCCEEFESRVLSGIKSLIVREPLDGGSRMYFLYELLENLLRYEKTAEDYEKIERAVYHPLNKKHLGGVVLEETKA